MSCYRPIHIWNNSKHFDIHQRVRHTVSCGHCLACKDARRMDWFVRAFYEFRNTQSKKGFTLAYTLTFDNDHVNFFHGRTAFRSTDIPLFIKRLRSYLSTHNPDFDFTYLACPEYGETYDRPHWHILFNVTSSKGYFKTFDFYNAVLQSWQNGFIHVKRGSQYGKILSVQALAYTVKYVTKELGLYSLDSVNFSAMRYAYREYLNDYAFDNPLSLSECYDVLKVDSHNEHLRKYYNMFREFRNELTPSVHASLKFGLCAINYLKDYDIDNEVIQMPRKGDYVLYPLPTYLKRKLYYTTIPNERDGKPTKYVITEFGTQHFMKMLEKKLADKEQQFKDLTSPVSNDCFDYIKQNLYARFPSVFSSANDLNIYLQYIQPKLRQVAIYAVVYDGCTLNNDIVAFDLFKSDVYSFFYSHLKTFHENVQNDSLSNSLHRSSVLDGYYATRRLFEEQDNALFVLNLISHYQLKIQKQAKFLRSAQIQEINDRLKFADYEKGNA